MKPTSPSILEHRPARHDHRPDTRRVHPATDYFFRPKADTTLGHVQRRADDSARRAFRKMTAEMLASQNRHGTSEMIAFALVAVLTAWPLVLLLIVLAETANG